MTQCARNRAVQPGEVALVAGQGNNNRFHLCYERAWVGVRPVKKRTTDVVRVVAGINYEL